MKDLSIRIPLSLIEYMRTSRIHTITLRPDSEAAAVQDVYCELELTEHPVSTKRILTVDCDSVWKGSGYV